MSVFVFVVAFVTNSTNIISFYVVYKINHANLCMWMPRKILFLSHSFYLWFFGWCVLTASFFTYVSIEFISFCGLSQQFQFSKPTITLTHICNINTIIRSFLSSTSFIVLLALFCYLLIPSNSLLSFEIDRISNMILETVQIYAMLAYGIASVASVTKCCEKKCNKKWMISRTLYISAYTWHRWGSFAVYWLHCERC